MIYPLNSESKIIKYKMDLHENVDGEEISEFAMAVINGTHPKYINSEPVPKYQDDKYLTVLVNH